RTREHVARLNEALQRQVLQLQTLFDMVPVGIAVAHDPECRTITSNRAAAAFLGVTPERNVSLSGAAPGRAAYRMLRDGKELPTDDLPLQRATRRRYGVETEELEITLADGRSYSVYCAAAPVLGDDGRTAGSIGVFLDVTGR